ncbi:hypothetical protein BDV29DRAFT_183795, partial [Aspergillus leporis]
LHVLLLTSAPRGGVTTRPHTAGHTTLGGKLPLSAIANSDGAVVFSVVIAASTTLRANGNGGRGGSGQGGEKRQNRKQLHVDG